MNSTALDERMNVVDLQGLDGAATGTPIKLQVRDIHKSYGANPVLRGVSLDAREGSVISIIGSSGSGKSTFLRCLNLLEYPSAGGIALDGEEIALVADPKSATMRPADRKQLQRLRARLAMVFQHFNL